MVAIIYLLMLIQIKNSSPFVPNPFDNLKKNYAKKTPDWKS